MTTESDTDVTREPFKTFDTIHRAFRERFQTGDVVVANRGVSVMVWTGDPERAALVFSASASTPQDMVRGLGLTSHSALLAEGEVARLRTALDAATHAHERDLLRLAKALGFDHEPPSDMDAMVAAVERMRGSIDGRTTPPTDAEIDAHHAAGGSWLTGDTVTWAPASLRGMRDDGEAEGCVWIALDRSDRPCAWPKVTP